MECKDSRLPGVSPRIRPVASLSRLGYHRRNVITGLAWIATAACALFTGGAVYATLVEHPARMACGPPLAVAHFRMSYPRGAGLQAPLAVGGCLAAGGAWIAGAAAGWLLAGLALGLTVPYTLVVMMPTNRRLLDRQLGPDLPETRQLLRRWGNLHLVRTGLGLLALTAMLRLLVSP